MPNPPPSFPPCPTPFSDHIYRTVAGVDLPLRVWPTGVAGQRPWLLWLHGGGFIAGKHAVPEGWVVPGFCAHGYHVVSVAYRLLPHATLPDMLSDAQAALVWCRAHLASAVGGAARLDVDAYVVGGDSAGGTLASLGGHSLRPRPRVVLDLFGVTDFTDPFFHVRPDAVPAAAADTAGAPEQAPSPHPTPRGALSGRFTRERIAAELADRDAAHAGYIGAYPHELAPALSAERLRSFWGMPDYEPGDADWLRMDMYTLIREERSLLLRLNGIDGLVLDPAARETLAAASPVNLVDNTYPPTFILHGKSDATVPGDTQAYPFAARLKENGVVVGELYPEGMDHCFEETWTGPEYEGWNEYIEPTLDFIDKHIRV
ncbi:hypothetical protein Q5752_000693 [Cryptotrichosporon argae]